jgi:hypothetical protein
LLAFTLGVKQMICCCNKVRRGVVLGKVGGWEGVNVG